MPNLRHFTRTSKTKYRSQYLHMRYLVKIIRELDDEYKMSMMNNNIAAGEPFERTFWTKDVMKYEREVSDHMMTPKTTNIGVTADCKDIDTFFTSTRTDGTLEIIGKSNITDEPTNILVPSEQISVNTDRQMRQCMLKTRSEKLTLTS